MFLLLYLVQAGLFFTIPLFLSVALGLSALETGIRILPLSITLLAAAIGVPRLYPRASPRRVVRLGLLALLLGVLFLMVALEPTADPQIVTLPLLLAGLGIGALASQLGAVTVSAVPDEVSPEVGGLQNTATNLGAAIGTALAGSILISSLTGAFLQGVEENNAVPPQVSAQAGVQLAEGVPFLSDADLRAALEQAAVPPDVSAAVLDVNATARVAGLRDALAVLLLISAAALVAARRIPDEPVGGGAPPSVVADVPPDRTS
jgi:MFS family permease